MQDSPRAPTLSPRPLHSSAKIVVSLQAYREARREGASQRKAAEKAGLPRSTLGDLDGLGKRNGVKDERDALVLSPAGLALVRQLIDAALMVFCVASGVGLPTFRRFLTLSGLDVYVASSHSVLHERLAALEAAFVKECDEERATLAKQVQEATPVVVGLDETFFGARTCLVAADLLTGFLLIETFAEARDRDAWKAAWDAGTAGLKLSVMHAISDGARGIHAFVEGDLGAHRAPDLFHILHDVGKAFACHLARLQRAAEGREEEARGVYAALAEFQLRRGQETRRGRPIDFDARKAEGRGCIASAAREVLVAKERREEFKAMLAALSAAYLPVSMASGEPKSAEALERELTEVFACLNELAKSSRLGEHHLASLRKAERCMPEMVEALAHFNAQVEAEIQARDLSREVADVLTSTLVPCALLEERARNTAAAEERGAIRERVDSLLGEAAVRLGFAVTDEAFLSLLPIAAALAALWQRTTSSIEGRNGTLSQRHHARRGLSEGKLPCATHVHNFFSQRKDGTTAAERFFGRKHRDVARAALEAMGDLKRPRHSRSAA
jgi:hypothetical protein